MFPHLRLRIAAEQPKRENEQEEEVSPAEDLMREHGVLKRVLLVYEEAAARLETNKDVPPDVIPAGANLIRRFTRSITRSSKSTTYSHAFVKPGSRLIS